ncbi:SPOR domain-containing protein [bacterium]|nr:SPOR domain-containing protein [bacterium]
MRLILLSSFLLLLSRNVDAQKISDPGLKPLVDLWQNDNVDSLRAALPSLQKKYPKQPETIFFQSVFETDAEKANAGYESILKTFPDNALADESLYRLIQFDYAKGSYRGAQEKADQLRARYPSSRFISKADRMFAGLNQSASTQIEEQTPVTDPDISQSTSGKKFRLQVGAFGQIKNAEDLRDKLKSNDYAPIEFSEKIVNDKKLFLVWVGAFDTKEEAVSNGNALKSKLQLNYTIVEK